MYGVLEDQFKSGMTEKEALKVAAKALLASAQRDAASGNGMDLAVITQNEFSTIGRNRTRRIAQAVLYSPAHAFSSPHL